MCKKWICGLLENILPIWGNRVFYKKIEEKIKKIENNEIQEINLSSLEFAGDLSKVSLQVVENTYKETLERKKKIEEKAKVNILGITVFIALISGLSSYVTKLYSVAENISINLGLFLLGSLVAFYVLNGGLLSLEVLMDKNKVYLLNEEELLLNKKLRKRVYARNIELNGCYNLIRNNYIYSSYQCIKHGLILMMILFCISIFPLYNNNSDEIKKEIKKINEKALFLEEGLKMTNLDLSNRKKELESIKEKLLIVEFENKKMKERLTEKKDFQNQETLLKKVEKIKTSSNRQ